MFRGFKEHVSSVLTSAAGSLVVYLLVAGGAGGILIAIWAGFSELSAALITALALSMAAVILSVAALTLVFLDKRARDQGDVSQAEVVSDEILWKHDGSWTSGVPNSEPLCPNHRVPVMIWKLSSNAFVYSDDIFDEERDELWCRGRKASEKHEIKLTESSSWKGARRLATVRIEAKIAENDK